MRKIKTIMICCLSVILLAACSVTTSGDKDMSTLEKAKKEGKIVVGFAGEKPYAYEDENGKLTGEAVEVARTIFKKMGIEEMEGKLTKFSSLIPGLKAGKFDVITAGMYITPERCEQVDFAEPDYTIGEGLAVQKGNPKNIHSYKDIAKNPDMKVSVMNGAIEIKYLEAAGVKKSQMEFVTDIPSNITALESKRVDAITMTGPTLNSALETANAKNIEVVEDFTQPVVDGESIRGYGAAAFKLGDDEIVQAYNKELKKLKESGELLDIISKFGFTESEIPGDVTAKELCQ
ncbi:ectoine/hydroxyectoine ABC transporter substrate-binding protein EhuB [Neobacillus mesonae]|uniref:ectoine/hydroxyectoine ABC transporter substrate-binding protein EhuB n=1 Tax=Neobacillus mesonae TaxID=1193713 RepID=UPI00203D314D|nr:ectoine/hydroxyectoine ABC transporter substrate-binding protein EhuB [Neobacillus mesonae]MCM3570458.1 ectoine/hydroxyectoine ABC transporter substrate-binding protein EhuB [Neobacillus mesonae]